jgi:hypothetical protein
MMVIVPAMVHIRRQRPSVLCDVVSAVAECTVIGRQCFGMVHDDV